LLSPSENEVEKAVVGEERSDECVEASSVSPGVTCDDGAAGTGGEDKVTCCVYMSSEDSAVSTVGRE